MYAQSATRRYMYPIRGRGHGLGTLGQEKPRIPEAAGRPWVRSLLTNLLGASDPVLEQHYMNSLRIGAMTFAEVQSEVMAKAAAKRATAAAAVQAARARVPAPPRGPAAGGVMEQLTALPVWVWWAGGGVLGLGVIMSMVGGRR